MFNCLAKHKAQHQKCYKQGQDNLQSTSIRMTISKIAELASLVTKRSSTACCFSMKPTPDTFNPSDTFVVNGRSPVGQIYK